MELISFSFTFQQEAVLSLAACLIRLPQCQLTKGVVNELSYFLSVRVQCVSLKSRIAFRDRSSRRKICIWLFYDAPQCQRRVSPAISRPHDHHWGHNIWGINHPSRAVGVILVLRVNEKCGRCAAFLRRFYSSTIESIIYSTWWCKLTLTVAVDPWTKKNPTYFVLESI